jgi:hypothetical protein
MCIDTLPVHKSVGVSLLCGAVGYESERCSSFEVLRTLASIVAAVTERAKLRGHARLAALGRAGDYRARRDCNHRDGSLPRRYGRL